MPFGSKVPIVDITKGKKPRRRSRKEVAGPYLTESSNPDLRARAVSSEHRTVPVRSTPSTRAKASTRSRTQAAARETRLSAANKAERRRATQKQAKRAARTEAAIKADKRRPQPKPAPSSKPARFAGRKTAGAPTQRELAQAKRRRQLRVNRKGFITTPKVRRAAQNLAQAKRNAPKATHEVSGIEDPQIRKAIVKHAPRVDKLARERYGISGEALLSKLVEGESNEEQGAVSTADAKSITQFIPSTREDFVTRLGVDPWANKNSAVKAATMHLDGKHGYNPGLEGYNPGGGQDYVNYILSQPVGEPVKTGRAETPRLRRARRAAQEVGLKAASPAKGQVSKKVLTRFKAAAAAAKQLEAAKLPYVWGGGHGDPASRPTGGGLDCSGAVSYVLNKMGAMKGSLVSGDMGQVLEPGPGAVTVFYNPTHTFMRIGKRYFGTSATNPEGGAGWIEGTPDDLSKYNVGHVPGLGKKVAVAMGVPLAGSESFPGMTLSSSGTSATIQSGAGATVGKPGFSSRPIKLTPAQRSQRKMRKLRDLGVGVGKGEGVDEAPTPTLSELERKYGVSG